MLSSGPVPEKVNFELCSQVLECWVRVLEVPGSIPSQGPRHTWNIIKIVPVVPLFSTQHKKGNTDSLSDKRKNNNTIFEGLMEDWLLSNELPG